MNPCDLNLKKNEEDLVKRKIILQYGVMGLFIETAENML